MEALGGGAFLGAVGLVAAALAAALAAGALVGGAAEAFSALEVRPFGRHRTSKALVTGSLGAASLSASSIAWGFGLGVSGGDTEYVSVILWFNGASGLLFLSRGGFPASLVLFGISLRWTAALGQGTCRHIVEMNRKPNRSHLGPRAIPLEIDNRETLIYRV
eukprot:1196352-Prorocentrum_minimum.AAC.2